MTPFLLAKQGTWVSQKFTADITESPFLEKWAEMLLIDGPSPYNSLETTCRVSLSKIPVNPKVYHSSLYYSF